MKDDPFLSRAVKVLDDGLVTVVILIVSFFSRQTLGRTPEPQVSDNPDQVDHYDQVMKTSMAAIYALNLNILKNLVERFQIKNARILELACGPGHVTKLLKRSIPHQTITIVDLSEPMLKLASERNQDAVAILDDITQLNKLGVNQYDIILNMNMLHHLESLEQVKQTIATMETHSTTNGLIFIYDLARLKTKWLKDLYTSQFGSPHVPYFQKDFELSMDAAWTIEEIQSIAPFPSGKTWVHLWPKGVTNYQMLVGIPTGMSLPDKLMSGISLRELGINEKYKSEYKMLSLVTKNLHRKILETSSYP